MLVKGLNRWVLPAILVLALGLPLLAPATAWGDDPLFRVLAVAHVSGQAPAPEFSLPTPDGKTIALAQLRGKVVFLSFWATWCPPCRVEMPSMERLYREFKDQGLVMLAVDMGESGRQVVRFMKEFRLTFPALLDADSQVASRYGVQGIPTTFLIDRSGRGVGAARGPRDWASPEAKALIRSLLERNG
jgi:peroxiredoxin